ncbi:MAG: hypothetical protein LAT80_09480 [Balneolaceae bacterium]|nr:hypothetical protein [Balneolaceae bacterium]
MFDKIALSIVEKRISLSFLLISTGWITLFLMVTGPRAFPGLPGAVYLHDLFFLFNVAFLGTYLVYGNSIKIPFNYLTGLFFLYLLLVITIPLIGVIYYQDYVSWVLGDLRWIQIFALFLTLYYGYKERSSELMIKHAERFIWALLIFQIPIILVQALILITNFSPPFFMEYWYPGGSGGYGYYGQHIGRFAGAMNNASGLALLGGVGFTYSTLMIFHQPKFRYFLLFLLGVSIMIAAGNRAMLLGAPALAGLVILIRLAIQLKIKKKLLALVAISVPTLVGLFALLYHYNIGRIATSNRYQQIIDLVTGQATFHQISGRGDDRWLRPLTEAFEHWSPIGTLVNSSHALNHLPAFDSYFVFATAQAGPFIIVPFIILIGLILIKGISNYLYSVKKNWVFVLALTVPLLISSFTQNTMTGMAGRSMLALSVLFIVAMMVQRSGPSIKYASKK